MMPLGSVWHSAYCVWAGEVVLTASLTETCAAFHFHGISHSGGSVSLTV